MQESINRFASFEDYLFQKARKQILYEFLRGDLTSEELFTINQNVLPILEQKEKYQVVIYDKYSLDQSNLQNRFAELLRISKSHQNSYIFLTVENLNVVILKGDFALRKIDNLLQKYTETFSSHPYSPLDNFFISCGRVVKSMEEIPVSYKDAIYQFQRRFFCNRRQHFITYSGKHIASVSSTENSYQNSELLEDYIHKFVILIQTYNRSRIDAMLNQLSAFLTELPVSIPAQKNWILDLYLGIKEKIAQFYKSSNIPFISNSSAIQYILNSNYLYEIIDFLSAQFEMIMNSTGNFTRDSIIDVILNYIDHNYSETITLDNISPIFGYNSSYLGKIFAEKTGMSFHTYLDNVRIEKAKELLLGSKLQVYRIAKQIGYGNVDYFHIKFKKSTGLSPAAYRKQYNEKQ